MTDEAEVLTPVVELEAAIEQTNAISVPNPVRVALVADLGPIASRLAGYQRTAEDIAVTTEDAEKVASTVCAEIAADIAAVKGHEVLSKITDGLHKLHRRFTGLRDAFVAPLEASRKQIKGKVIVWQQAEQEKAQKEQARLQAIADEKARKERERLEREAAKLKTPEKIEQRLEQAAAVIAPTIVVQAPKSSVRMQKRWVVKSLDLAAFLQACIADGNLLGYITIDMNKLTRSKAANTLLDIPGVVFEQKTV